MRRALRRLVGRVPRFYVAGEAASAEEALDRVKQCEPSLFLVDVNLPGMNGIELIAALTRRSPACCVAMSAYAGPERVRAALEAGAQAFASKDEPHELAELLPALMDG